MLAFPALQVQSRPGTPRIDEAYVSHAEGSVPERRRGIANDMLWEVRLDLIDVSTEGPHGRSGS